MNHSRHGPVVRLFFLLILTLGAASHFWSLFCLVDLPNPLEEGILTAPPEPESSRVSPRKPNAAKNTTKDDNMIMTARATAEKEKEKEKELEPEHKDIHTPQQQQLVLTEKSSIATPKRPVRKPNRSPRHVYWCGYPNMFNQFAFNMGDHLFPENSITELRPGFVSGKDDVLLYPCGGPCTIKVRSQIPIEFKGQVVSFNGESTPCLSSHHQNVVPVSAIDAGFWKNSSGLQALFMSMHMLTTVGREYQDKIFRSEHYFRGSNHTRDRFLIYAVSNCVGFREQAFSALSHLGKVEYGGRCMARSQPGRNVSNIVRAPDAVIKSGWGENHIIFQPYRFALVMENKQFDRYITEKILNAFLAGCIPIYYGTPGVFDIFNKKAFIWYDINDPKQALDRIAYLEKNRTAYNEVVKEPVLANGEETIRKYFSWNDELGNGDIKWFIRDLLGFG
jgi:hypothetical protein